MEAELPGAFRTGGTERDAKLNRDSQFQNIPPFIKYDQQYNKGATYQSM